MPFDIGAAGNALTGGLIGTGLGLMMEKHEDARQLNQQQKLSTMQYNINKQTADDNYKRSLDMWNATNYEAQIEHLKAAGLNPSLLYGKGGGGGATAAAAPAQGVSTGEAPKGNNEAAGMGLQIAQMSLQTKLLDAQIKNIEADTANKEANTSNTGVDTKQKQLELEIRGETRDVAIERIQAEAVKVDAEMEQAKNNRKISDATYQTDIAAKKAELAGIYLRNDQVREQTKLTDAQIDEVIQSIQTQIKSLQQRDREINVQEVRNELIKTGIWVGAGTQIVGDIISIFKTPKNIAEKVTEIFDDGHGSKTISTRNIPRK